MTRLIEILISLAIVAALMLLVALVLPSSRHLSESVETNRKMTIVFDTVNSLRRFTDWNALAFRDPQRSEEQTSDLQSLMLISYDVFCLKKKKYNKKKHT